MTYFDTDVAYNRIIQTQGATMRNLHSTDTRNKKIRPFAKPSEILRVHGIERLYHFTHIDNLPSIRRHGGLLSCAMLRRRGVPVTYASDTLSRSIDAYKGLSDYVRLSFVKNLPMYWRVVYNRPGERFVWLEIDLSIIDRPDVRVTPRNAASNGVVPAPAPVVVPQLPLELLAGDHELRRLKPEAKILVQAEVLVKRFVPMDAILNFDHVAGGV